MSIDGKARILLTGGRAPSALELARHLQEAGHYIVTAESCIAPLCNAFRAVNAYYHVPSPRQSTEAFTEALIQVIERERIDLLIPTCEEIFYIAARAEQLQPYCQLFIDQQDKLLALHHKKRFVEMTEVCALPVPKTFELKDRTDWEQMISQPGKWVLKPVYSRFSTKVQFIDVQVDGRVFDDTTAALLDTEKLAKQYAAGWIAQSYIEGQAYCSYSVVQHGQITAHAVYPVEFTAGGGSCISFRAVDIPKVNKWIEQFVKFYQIHGQIGFDFIIDKAGSVYAIECNPRTTSGVHLFHAHDRLAAAFFSKEIKAKPSTNACAVITMAMLLFGVSSLRSVKGWKRWWQLLRHGRDVIFRWNDPLPFFQQIRYLWSAFRISRQQKISLMEATTFDIEWNGEHR